MALKFKVKSKEEIPAGLETHYVERDGAWVLDAEGAVEKARLDEMRNNSIAVSNQLAEHKKRFEGIDPDQVRKVAEEKQRLRWSRWKQPVREESVPQGKLEPHGANEVAENRPAARGPLEGGGVSIASLNWRL
jgi:hypothetical protein